MTAAQAVVPESVIDDPPIRSSTLQMRPALQGWREAQLRDVSLRDLWRAAQGDTNVPYQINWHSLCS